MDTKHQIIVYAEAFGRGQDHENLSPMLEGAKRNTQTIGEGESYFEGKQLSADSKKPSLVEEMKAKIDTPPGKKIYSRRLAIVEPVFANILAQKRLDRFLLRTKTKVDVQWRLFALVHNIEKIQHYGLAN